MSHVVASMVASVVNFVLVPVILSGTTKWLTRALAVATAVAMSFAFDTGALVPHALLAGVLSGAIGLLVQLSSEGRLLRTCAGLAFTVALLFVLPCLLVPTHSEPYYLRGAETLVLAVSMAIRPSSLPSTWTIWSVSPAFVQFELVRVDARSFAGVRAVVGGMVVHVLATTAAVDLMQQNRTILATVASVAIGMPAIGTMRYGACLLAGFDPGRGFTWPIVSWDLSRFWARWNSWYGRSFGDLVHVPLTRGLLRTRFGWKLGARRASAIGAFATFLCVGLHHDLCRAITMASLGTSSLFEPHFETLLLFAGLGVLAAFDTCFAGIRVEWVRRIVRAHLVAASLILAIAAIAAWRT